MQVADILRIKGSTVKTVTPDKTALQLSEQLRDEQIGAAIVRDDALRPERTSTFASTCDDFARYACNNLSQYPYVYY